MKGGKTLGIIGVGLMGGSLALRAKKFSLFQHIIGVEKNQAHARQALKKGIVDEILSFPEALEKSDVILVALPVSATAEILPQILDQIQPHQFVFDLASTKEHIVNSVKNHIARQNYVATHPMWGTENSGPLAATEESFENKVLVICDAEDSREEWVKQTQDLYQKLGMKVIFMDSKSHDLHAAYISHISHVTSYALANTVLEKEKEERIFQLASSGFSSTVRLAKSHADMWLPIFKHNRENVLDVLEEHITQLQKFQTALIMERYNEIENYILNANKIRKILDKKI
ncbi:prephenate dehydrogenase [Candidatus Ornithobacterium hominis]|uniref:prephenate dehydrogenase n=1 Tax=Candidatus Ornithobacterium hominis TaxID=2497989 RepID=UPI0024BC2BC4|nr:prephenate dehydrogenase [Candidatus Ornithobacterium hominis]CAI9430397.1 prephenate dehydrogenase [Candidatus Ornithobacterium hominis]